MPLNRPRSIQHDGTITGFYKLHAAPPHLKDLALCLSAEWTFQKTQKRVGAHARLIYLK